VAAQEPTLAVNFRLTVDLATALDEHCRTEEEATGNPITRADVMRLALAQYLGVAKRKTADQQQPAAGRETNGTGA
jgi:hypothetical protein